MTAVNWPEIRAQAEREWREEKYRQLVDAEKARTREAAGRSWFQRVFPWRLVVVKL